MCIEKKFDRNAEWKTSMDLMRGLFPKWIVSIDQLRSWKEKFGMLNPEWFRESLNIVYHKYNSDTPKPKWVQDAFFEVRAGHQGIPLRESDAAEIERQKAIEERQREIAIAETCRENAWELVSRWSAEDREYWGNLFKNKYNFGADGRNEITKFDTWNKTFTQFVKVFREREEGAALQGG